MFLPVITATSMDTFISTGLGVRVCWGVGEGQHFGTHCAGAQPSDAASPAPRDAACKLGCNSPATGGTLTLAHATPQRQHRSRCTPAHAVAAVGNQLT
jgi:hypothetical protein